MAAINTLKVDIAIESENCILYNFNPIEEHTSNMQTYFLFS